MILQIKFINNYCFFVYKFQIKFDSFKFYKIKERKKQKCNPRKSMILQKPLN